LNNEAKSEPAPEGGTGLTASQTERLELYRLVTDTITANEARRQQMMTIYVSLIVAGFAAIGSIEALDPLYVVAPALPLSLVWLASLRYFRALSEAKFKVIDELEQGLTVKPFAMEWALMKQPKLGLSVLEMTLPIAVCLGCITYGAFRLILWQQ